MQPRQNKEKNLYRPIIRTAWNIAWNRREYWPLGFLAAFLMMNGGAFEFITRAFYKIASGAPYDGILSVSDAVVSSVASGDSLTRASLFVVVLICLAVFAAMLILAAAAGGGLLRAAHEAALKRKLSSRAAFAAGMDKVGPLVLTQLVGRLTIFVAFAVAALGAFIAVGDAWGNLLAVGLFVAFAVAALGVSFLMMMTDAGIMISGQSWIHAAHDAIRFLRRHWLISLEMISFVFVAAVASAFAIVAFAIVMLVPFTLLLAAMAAIRSLEAVAVVSFAYEIVIVASVGVVAAVLASFERSAWAILYLRLGERGAAAKLERLWKHVASKIHARFGR